ncbi:PEP-CTERM sorting domain-containing protein [Kiritimatiellota bacterium B12222]|nr:PEP-CTERM sorting domain-containing protein [Kiritimatiellota bacterium B12222]
MTFLNKLSCFVWGGMLSLCCIRPTYSDVLITDFDSFNPLSFPYGGASWATPVAQFDYFTDGSVTGQQVLPIAGGNPTVSGGAWRNGLSLDLSGMSELELRARLLADNEAGSIQILLFDADGTYMRYTFSASYYNTSTFDSGRVDVADGVIAAPGSVPGLDLAAITAYLVQGNYYDSGGAADAKFNVQLDQLLAVSVPEPAGVFLFLLGCGVVVVGRKRA